MGEVRSRAGVLGVATGVAVLAVLPVVAFAQVPGADGVVAGVTDTAGGIVEAPAVPSLPTAPVPVPKPPAVSAPAVQAPAVPAPAPKAPEPVGSLLQQSSSPSGGGGTAGGGSASQTSRSGGSGPAAKPVRAGGRQSHVRSSASGGRKARHRDHGAAHAKAAADSEASGGGDAGTANVAMAEDTADPLPDAPSPAKSPFTGLALGLLFIIGLCALALGGAVRGATSKLSFRRATS
jgi:hypothetical protein